METKEVEAKKDDGAKEEQISVGPKEFQTLVAGFDKLQSEIVTLRKEMVKASDETHADLKESVRVAYKNDLENLGNAVYANSVQLSSLQDKLDLVISTQNKFGPVDKECLNRFIADGRTVFTKLDDISSIRMAGSTESGELAKEILDKKVVDVLVKDNATIIAKLEEVRETTKSLREDKKDKTLNRMEENAAKVMPVQLG